MELADVRDSKSRGGNTVWVRPPSPAPKSVIMRPKGSLGGNMNQQMYQLAIIVFFAVAMYFILIKPQRKRDRETDEMRNNIQVGDEIVTIGGICGKVVKTKDDSIVIQVGADRTKLEFKRWAISAVDKKANTKYRDVEPAEEKKVRPKRLGKKAESLEDEAQALIENTENAVNEVVEDASVEG